MPRRHISYAQKGLPFAGQGARAIADPLKREWFAVYLMTAFVLVSSIAYGYGVVQSIAQVSIREAALKEVRLLTAERASLESALLAQTSGITEEYARTLGFRDTTNRVFVSLPRTLSYADNAR